jgi:uncharacterized membrane protein
MEEKQKTIYRKLKILFVTSILLDAACFLPVLFMTKWNESNVALERYAILLTLIAIPAALKIFYSRTGQPSETNRDIYLKKYQKMYCLRLLILEAVFLFNLISFYTTGAKNFIFMIIITIFALAFCAPQKTYTKQNETDNN